MSEFVACVSTERDCRILTRYYKEARYVRVNFETLSKTLGHLSNFALWFDAGVDALDRWPNINEVFKPYMANWDKADRMVDPVFQQKPAASIVQEFVESVLSNIPQHTPTLLSVPQFPIVHGNDRNRINRQLASATAGWKVSHKYGGKLVLPAIITHSSQIKLKAERTKRLHLIKQCIDASGAESVWVVDSSLYDQEGTSTLEGSRFPALLAFHQELRDYLGDTAAIIAGPYWGFNLVLWCRGLVESPLIGLGNAYQYHLAGGFPKQSKSRIALSSLRRWAVASSQLEGWIEEALTTLSPSDPIQSEFAALLKQYPQISLDGRGQVAAFYRTWLAKLEAVPKAGRALAMYQDLSSAYVLGKSMPDLPKDEGTSRRPERIAKQLMMFCL